MLMDGDISSLLPSANANNRRDLPSADGEEGSSSSIIRPWDEKYRQLSEQISSVLDDYSLVKFMPLNPEDEVFTFFFLNFYYRKIFFWFNIC